MCSDRPYLYPYIPKASVTLSSANSISSTRWPFCDSASPHKCSTASHVSRVSSQFVGEMGKVKLSNVADKCSCARRKAEGGVPATPHQLR